MKFFKGQDNARVYCREVSLKDKTFVVIAVEFLIKKKTNQIDTERTQHYTQGSR